MIPLDQHQVEIEQNLKRWNSKPLLQSIYHQFYQCITGQLDRTLAGKIVEIGSGIGNLKSHCPEAICTDLFPNPWLDLVCDGYELPFRKQSVSNLVLFDVFHHLQAPKAFLREAKRVLVPSGRLILFEPYISWASFPVYGFLHHEPVGWGKPIDFSDSFPRPRHYYAAQGNATRLFFRATDNWLQGWRIVHQQAYSAFAYLLSGGYSKPAFYPSALSSVFFRLDAVLSKSPKMFGGRCLVVLTPATGRTVGTGNVPE